MGLKCRAEIAGVYVSIRGRRALYERRRYTERSAGANTSEDAWHEYTIKEVRILLAENLRFPG